MDMTKNNAGCINNAGSDYPLNSQLGANILTFLKVPVKIIYIASIILHTILLF